MKKLAIGLSALALAATGTAAYAAHHEGRPNPDANGDGIVTRAEAQAHAGQMFARMDANNDGKIDQTDREARRAERRAKMFAALDTDGNGQISKAEFVNHKHEGKRGWKGRGHGRHGKMMEMADTNNDGAVSKAEVTAGALKHFERTDANGDGQVTQEERQAARQQMREQWRAKMHERSEN